MREKSLNGLCVVALGLSFFGLTAPCQANYRSGEEGWPRERHTAQLHKSFSAPVRISTPAIPYSIAAKRVRLAFR